MWGRKTWVKPQHLSGSSFPMPGMDDDDNKKSCGMYKQDYYIYTVKLYLILLILFFIFIKSS